MGLDSGIEIRRRADLPAIAFTYFDDEYSAKYNFDLEVAYWRKCWNVRAVIYKALNVKEENDSKIKLSKDDLNKIIKELKKINKRNWLDNGSCIWEWKEFKKLLRKNIKNLCKLRRLMKKYEGIEAYFYDSY